MNNLYKGDVGGEAADLISEFIRTTQAVTQQAAITGGARGEGIERPVEPLLDDQIRLEVTALGKATFLSCIDTCLAGRLYKDLWDALGAINLQTPLHLLYIAIPYDFVDELPNIDWNILLSSVQHSFPFPSLTSLCIYKNFIRETLENAVFESLL